MHVGSPPPPSPYASSTAIDVQAMLLADESIVEGILLCIGGRIPRFELENLHVTTLAAVNDTIISTLARAKLVCKVWRAAAARPIVAAALDKALGPLKLVTEFYENRRSAQCEGRKFNSRPTFCSPGSEVNRSAMEWLVAGFENGLHSCLSDDEGIDSIAPCAALIGELVANGLRGPFVIAAPEYRWRAWRDSLRTYVPHSPIFEIRHLHDFEEQMFEYTSDDDEEERCTRQFAGILLVPINPGSEVAIHPPQAASLADSDRLHGLVLSHRRRISVDGWLRSFSQAIRSQGIKLMVFDERHYQPPGLSMGELELSSPASLGSVCTYVRINHLPLPSDLPQLALFIEDCLNLNFKLAHSIGAVLDNVDCWPQAAWLRRWAVEAFVVPTLQSAISRVAVRRRVLRAGEPCDVQVEPAAHVVVELGAVCEADGVRHWLVGCRVRVKGLLSKPEYNGKVGHVHAYNAAVGRFEVCLDRHTDRSGIQVSSKWLRLREGNLTTSISTDEDQ